MTDKDHFIFLTPVSIVKQILITPIANKFEGNSFVKAELHNFIAQLHLSCLIILKLYFTNNIELQKFKLHAKCNSEMINQRK